MACSPRADSLVETWRRRPKAQRQALIARLHCMRRRATAAMKTERAEDISLVIFLLEALADPTVAA